MQGADDGLLARFIWFWPDPFPFNKPNRPPAADWAIAAFDRLRILDLAAGEDGSIPLLVMLDDAAAQRLVRFAQLMQERKEMTIGLMRSAIGKARGLVPPAVAGAGISSTGAGKTDTLRLQTRGRRPDRCGQVRERVRHAGSGPHLWRRCLSGSGPQSDDTRQLDCEAATECSPCPGHAEEHPPSRSRDR
jgi:hypothetical protein